MEGQMSIAEWLASMAAAQEAKEPAEQQEKEPDRPSEVRIRQGSAWKTVPYEEARKWARGKWEALKGVQEPYRAQYINMCLVEGVEFRNEELKGKGA